MELRKYPTWTSEKWIVKNKQIKGTVELYQRIQHSCHWSLIIWKKEGEAEKVFEEIIGENSPNLENLQIQETE